MITPNLGRPGVGPARSGQYRFCSRDGNLLFYPGGGTIEGTKSRDPDNADDVLHLRAGLLMGKITTGGYWAPAIIGVTQGAYTSGGTSLTLTAAQAVELVRRIGSSGTFNLIGPASAAGANATTQVTYSAVNTTTGVVTITNIGANRIAGCFVAAEDGSQVPRTVVPDGFGILVPSDSADVPFPMIPVGGMLDTAQIINWPADTTLRTYVRESLSTLAGGKWTFSDQF